MIADILHKIKEFESEESYPYSPRPSLAGPERCIRFLDYYRQGYERKPFPGRFMVVLEDSSIHEALIQDIINRSAFRLHSSQMKVECGAVNGVPIIGHIDGIVTDLFGQDRLLEIKALSHFVFQEIWAGAMPLDYIYQTCLYLRGLHEINPDIREAILLIKNKNQSQFCEIVLNYQFDADSLVIKEMVHSTGERKAINQTINNAAGSVIAKFTEVEQYASEQRLHDRQYAKDNWHCQYCPFGEECWLGWEEEIESREVDVTLPGEYADTAKYYKELGGQISDLEKEKDMVKGKLKGILQKYNAKKAIAGEYVIAHSLRSKETIDQTRIPATILEQAKVKNPVEVVTVSKVAKVTKVAKVN